MSAAEKIKQLMESIKVKEQQEFQTREAQSLAAEQKEADQYAKKFAENEKRLRNSGVITLFESLIQEKLVTGNDNFNPQIVWGNDMSTVKLEFIYQDGCSAGHRANISASLCDDKLAVCNKILNRRDNVEEIIADYLLHLNFHTSSPLPDYNGSLL